MLWHRCASSLKYDVEAVPLVVTLTISTDGNPTHYDINWGTGEKDALCCRRFGI